MEFETDIHEAQRMNSDPMTFCSSISNLSNFGPNPCVMKRGKERVNIDLQVEEPVIS